MPVTPTELAGRYDVTPKHVRDVLRAHYGTLQTGSTRWDLTDEQVAVVERELVGESGRPLRGATTPDLLGQYADILAELRARGVVRTSNAPLGDYAEYVALEVYGGELAANSAKSYDLKTTDGRLIQVKARTWAPSTSPSAVFSVFRSFDFDIATLIVLDARTYRLRWAREMTPEAIKSAARWSPHVNGFLLRMSIAEREGADVTERFAPVVGTLPMASDS
ncbi:DUF6998 domain-containing protein [Agromyces sp. MMS24-JH15]|uniref:DUF6998 domain-containing protein n=1 Tax=Agromyces sp. MMS24-JH15 TaxID=3243765 RepID=UPI003748AA27